MVAPRKDPALALLDELLADQQRLQTPVTRAALAYDVQPSAWRAERFRELIPLTAPAPGQQYAFEVDLDACSGCKACVAGCHSLNGLDDEETWRDVGLVTALAESIAETPKTSAARADSLVIGHWSFSESVPAFAQTVTTACHHCADPACLNGCPVLAYEKDPVTGVVVHLDDQCIGCSYCVLKCPYDVPKYNQRLGIVRKCDLCHGRLAAGEAPACAQACPTQAIRVVLVDTAKPATPPDAVISLAADLAYTQPTTRYVSRKPLPKNLRAADADTLRLQHTHWALVFLLVFTQAGLGLLLASLAGSQISALSSQLGLTGLAFFTLGLIASVAHLGQPLRAWRVFLGLRRSWLSREAVLLGAAFPLLAANVLWAFVAAYLPDAIRHWSSFMGYSGLVFATLGVVSSGMIYIDTRRHFWRPAATFARMGGTVVIVALSPTLPLAAAITLALKLAAEHFLAARSPISHRLLTGPLRPLQLTRYALGAATISIWLIATVTSSASLSLGASAIGLFLFLAGEIAERALYFRAVDAPKMPGVPATAAH
jgi:Fe-S-cluster-containing dehydrogenase component/DMSO reductase anchor subunit